MKYLPSVINAEYVKDYIIDLHFNDGTKKKVDFSVWLEGEIFEPLKDRSFFKKFFLDSSTVAWPNGADIAPETLYAADSAEGNAAKVKTSSNKVRKSA